MILSVKHIGKDTYYEELLEIVFAVCTCFFDVALARRML